MITALNTEKLHVQILGVHSKELLNSSSFSSFYIGFSSTLVLKTYLFPALLLQKYPNSSTRESS